MSDDGKIAAAVAELQRRTMEAYPPNQSRREAMFKIKVRLLLDFDRYPSPLALGVDRSSGLNGRECKWRDEVWVPWLKAHRDHPITIRRHKLTVGKWQPFDEWFEEL